MILKNILEELGNFLSIILEDSTNLLEVLAPFAALLGGPLTLKKGKLEKCGLNCQSFLWISKKVWFETHQYLNWLSKIKGISLKLKNQKRFLFRPRQIHSSHEKTVKISCGSPFKGSYVHFPNWPGHILLLFCLACSLRSATLNIPHTIVHPAVLYWTFYSCYTSYNTVFIQSRLNSKLFLSKFYNLFLNQNHNGADIFHGCILTSCNTVYTILLASSGYILLYRCTVHLSLHKASWCFRCTLSSAKRHHHIH